MEEQEDEPVVKKPNQLQPILTESEESSEGF